MTQPALAQPTRPSAQDPQRVAQAVPLILVIDDSLTVCKVVEVTLQRAGFLVLSFPDGVTALRWLASPDVVMPALIYLDIGLPKLDGYEVVRLLRGRPALARTPIIMLSSRDRVLDRVKSRLAGAHNYLSKPFKTAELLALTCSTLSIPSPVARTEEEQP